MNGGEQLLAATLTRLDDDDVRTLRHEWSGQCGACDAGMPANCTCPMDDPRAIIVALTDEVLRLRNTAPKETPMKFRVLVREDAPYDVEAARIGFVGDDNAPVLTDKDNMIVAWINPEHTLAVVAHTAAGGDV